MSKKIWFIICEGATDREFIEHIHDIYESANIRVEVYSGDFLTSWESGVTLGNVTTKINSLFEEKIGQFMSKRKIFIDDIEQVIYMTDTDKAFELDTPKKEMLRDIAYKNSITTKGTKIPLKLLLISNDLEHITSDYDASINGKLTLKEKSEMIYTFLEEHETKESLNDFFSTNKLFPFIDYNDFQQNFMTINGRCTNLNTIYKI